ncbi:MAG TPA: amidase [Candidatus Tetragenococcus pullicola]|nr:amidase [Candidatus Tetragenococcus pullicola]
MQDATYWTDQLKKGTLSFSEHVAKIAEKVEQYNPDLNALVTFDPEAALKQHQHTSYKERLFGGQPIPLKMLGQNKAGWQATSASQLFSKATANQTNHFVKRLEQIGFIPLGQTNAPEFGFKNITDPALYGDTRNPWNSLYSPGGSSGGAAATVASGIFPIAGASDGGGSIRIPASFSGLIGLKPTRGTMPVGPDEWRSWQGASISFALTISMRDTKSLFYAMRTSQPSAPYQAPKAEWNHTKETTASKPLTIAFTTQSPVGDKISDTAVQAVKEAATFLEQQGHKVVEINYPVDGQEMMESYYVMNGGETAAMFSDINATREKAVTSKDMELMTWALYQYGEKIAAASYIKALQYWDYLAEKMEDLFISYDLFLTPTTAFSAPLIEEDLQSDSIRARLKEIEAVDEKTAANLVYEMFEKSYHLTPYTQLANLTGQPAISLPTAVTEKNLPLGIQFMASKGREDLLLQVGQLFEANQKFHLPKQIQ